MSGTYERMLARSIADSINETTPGGVTRDRILRKHAPLLATLAWLPVIAALLLAAFAVITR